MPSKNAFWSTREPGCGATGLAVAQHKKAVRFCKRRLAEPGLSEESRVALTEELSKLLAKVPVRPSGGGGKPDTRKEKPKDESKKGKKEKQVA